MACLSYRAIVIGIVVVVVDSTTTPAPAKKRGLDADTNTLVDNLQNQLLPWAVFQWPGPQFQPFFVVFCFTS